MFKMISRFIKKTVKSAYKAVVGFFKGTLDNAAGITILVGSAIGFTKIISELSHSAMLPMWIEASMFAPVLSVLVLFVLIQIMKFQMEFSI